MIYLIKSVYIKDISKGLVLDNLGYALKIGFTTDECGKNRFLAYTTHNKTYEVIDVIKGCSLIIEFALHKKFRNYQIAPEWFEYRDEIVEFLKANHDEQSLTDSLSSIVDERIIKDQIKKEVESIDSILFSFVNHKLIELKLHPIENFITNDKIDKYYELGMFSKEDIEAYLLSQCKSTAEEYQEFKSNTSELVMSTINKFNSLTQFQDRMKLVCELDLTADERVSVLLRIPIQYKKYYETLGPEKCKALGYVNYKLSEEYYNQKKLLQDDKIQSMVYNTFKVGERYSKSYIKQELKEIYDHCHCTSLPKAVDLEFWFEIKICNVPNKDTGKRDKGFEILKRI